MDRCQDHVRFGPKYRRKVVTNAVAVRMNELVLATHTDDGSTIIALDGLPDHGQLIRDVDPRAGIYVVVGTIMGFTSHEHRNEVPGANSAS